MRWVSMYDPDSKAPGEPDGRDEDLEAPPAVEEDAVAPSVSAARGDATDGVGQGSYVMSFAMSRDQVASGVMAARAMFPQLLSECSWSPAAHKITEPAADWRRAKSGKCAARVWEKGGAGKSKRAPRKLPASKSSTTASQHAASTPATSGSGSSTSTVTATDSEAASVELSSRASYSVRSSVTIDAPLDAVLKTLDASVLTAHRSFTKIIYGGLVSEATVLSHHDGRRRPGVPSATDASAAEALTVRWLVCRCNSPMASDCDLCLQEYTRRHSIDELAANSAVYNNNNNNDHSDCYYNERSGSGDDGERVARSRDGLHPETEIPAAYKLFQSVETRFCPELLDSQRLVRCRVPLGGFLLYPTDCSERTDVVFFMSVARQERTDRQFRALQSVALEMARRVERLRNAVDAHRMSLRLDALRSSRWVDDSARPECAVCARRFHQLSRRRHHCRLCGEVICRDCSVHKDADLPTIGPTVLRICRQCDASTDGVRLQALQSSPPASAVVVGNISSNQRDQSGRNRRMSWRRATAIEITASTQTPLAPTTPTPATATAKVATRAVNANLVSPTPLQSRRRFSNAVDALPSGFDGAAQAFSCPKPALGQRAFRWGTPSCESGGRLATKAIATTPTAKSHAYSSSTPGIWRPVVSTPSHWAGTTSISSSSSAVASSLQQVDTRAKALSSASPVAQRWSQRSVDQDGGKLPKQVADSAVAPGSPNQHTDASSTHSLVPRGVSKLHEVQDVLVELCTQAADLCGTKYAALSLFRDRPLTASNSSASLRAAKSPQQQPEDDSGAASDKNSSLAAGIEHFLKVRGSHKLMNVAPNLKSCEPVLALRRSVATRHAASARLGFDLRQLPIVSGPQQARFYAGVLLVDSRRQWLGALAVFDSRVSGRHDAKEPDDELESLLRGLEKLADAAVASVREREKELALRQFLQSPLVETRSSEPGNQAFVRPDELRRRSTLRGHAGEEGERGESEEERRQEHSGGHARELYRRKMRELVQQAQETQAQTLEHSVAIKRDGLVSI